VSFRSWPARGAALVFTVVIGAAAGCGGSGPTGPAAKTISPDAPVVPGRAPTAGELAGRLGAGLAGIHTGTALITLGPASAPTMRATVSLDTDTSELVAQSRTAAGVDLTRVTEGEVYLRGPTVAPLVHGRAWARIGLDQVLGIAAAGGQDPAVPGDTVLPQPGRVVGLLLSVVTPAAARPAGPLAAGGRTYPLSMPVAAVDQLAAALGTASSSPLRTRLRAWVSGLTHGGVTTLAGELTLDARGRPVQLRAPDPATAVAAPNSGGPLVVDFRNWGAPVSVAAPPADRVADITPAQLAAVIARVGR